MLQELGRRHEKLCEQDPSFKVGELMSQLNSTLVKPVIHWNSIWDVPNIPLLICYNVFCCTQAHMHVLIWARCMNFMLAVLALYTNILPSWRQVNLQVAWGIEIIECPCAIRRYSWIHSSFQGLQRRSRQFLKHGPDEIADRRYCREVTESVSYQKCCPEGKSHFLRCIDGRMVNLAL